MRNRIALFLVPIVGLLAGLLPVAPAAAVGALNLQFSVSGTLPLFPCELGCTTTFSGSASGGGNAVAVVGGDIYDATFAMFGVPINGTASYAEPGVPLCPAIGAAAGSVTLGGVATGLVHREGTPTPGVVTGVTIALTFEYTRVGVSTAIVISGGTVTVSYFVPGSGAGSFTKAVVEGMGSGVFAADAATLVAHCMSPGSLPYSVAGDASVALL